MAADTLKQITSLIVAYRDSEWASQSNLDPIQDHLSQLLSHTASNSPLNDLIKTGAPNLLAKIVSEASVSAAEEDKGSRSDQLCRIRHMCISILSNMCRDLDMAQTVIKSDACMEVVMFSLMNEQDSMIIHASVHVFQTLITVLDNQTIQLLPLVSMILDMDAQPIHHLQFIALNTLSVPLFQAAVKLWTSLIWLLHCRLTVEPISADNPQFPIIPKHRVEPFVAYLVNVLGPDQSSVKNLDLSWGAADVVVKSLSTLALISIDWKLLLSPHATKLTMLFAKTWPSLVYDPDLKSLVHNWVYLLSSLPSSGWPNVYRIVLHIDKHAADQLLMYAEKYKLDAMRNGFLSLQLPI